MITVREYTSKEVTDWQNRQYKTFLKYYHETNHPIKDILHEDMGLNRNCSTTRYIRKRLREDGLNGNKRHQLIMKGEWIC